jgi:cell division protein FtsB
MTMLADTTDLSTAARVLELEEQLARERARNEGLERGIEALSATVEELRRENERLRSAASLT